MTEAPNAAAKYADVITWLSLALTSVLLHTTNLTTPFCPFWPKSADLEDRHKQRSYLAYGSAAITLSAALTSDAA
jgi:hypothetical protein